MAFRAQCVFCGHHVRAPDQAVGASVCCPKCSSFFTLAPMAEARGPVFVRGPEPRQEALLKTAVAPSPPSCPPRVPDAQQALEHELGASTLGDGRCRGDDDSKQTLEHEPGAGSDWLSPGPMAAIVEEPPPGRRWLEPLGLGVWVVGGGALLCASVPVLCRFVIPLAALGMIVGAVGLLRALVQRRSRLPVPAIGMALVTAVVCTALLSPRLLGPAFLAYRARDAADSDVIRVVPFAGSLLPAGGLDPEWLDASQAALQQGRVNLRVISAHLRRVTAKSAAAEKLSAGDYYFIRLRTQEVVPPRQFAAARSQAPAPRFDKVRPRLLNLAGKACELSQVLEATAVQKERKASTFPVAVQDQVFVFEASPTGQESLRLEVPAEAWSQRGSFRFTVPSSMIQDDRSRLPGRPGHQPGAR
jgi:hypothetical protein